MGGRKQLAVHGARENNLKDITVSLPHDAITAVVGPSGSGKSSLVIDTVVAEASRRCAQLVSTQARLYLPAFERPDVDRIEGLRYVVFLEQDRPNENPRSTLGTLTDIYDLVRILVARTGEPGCECGGVSARESGQWVCSGCSRNLEVLEPKDLSFNLPYGQCPSCEGLGTGAAVNRGSLVDPTLPVAAGGIRPFDRDRWKHVHRGVIEQLVTGLGYSPNVTFAGLPTELQQLLLDGIDVTVTMRSPSGETYKTDYTGAVPWLLAQQRSAATDGARRRIDPFFTRGECPQCHGTRLNASARSYQWHDKSLREIVATPLLELAPWLASHTDGPTFDLVHEATRRAEALNGLGLGYLTLMRAAPTLSGGELQRARLAMQLGSDLTGMIVVLDEPSSGLHPLDVDPLTRTLTQLRDAGNTVILVEHNPTVYLTADHLIEMGPGPGSAGGTVVRTGPPETQSAVPATSRSTRPIDGDHPAIRISGGMVRGAGPAMATLPWGALTALVGVSGSGKSSFVGHVLLPALESAGVMGDPDVIGRDGSWLDAEIPSQVARVTWVDQRPIGRNSRSNPATYLGAFDAIRTLFAATPAARRRKLTASHFSFNRPEGRCPTCDGEGAISTPVALYPNVRSRCEDCEGRRFTQPVLDVTINELSIADVLDLSVTEALALFTDTSAIARPLSALIRVGLGYLRLGQPAPDLSGGEAQRLKLAKELAAPGGKGCLYIFDEPSKGLSPVDVNRLLAVFDELLDSGGSVVVIEHNSQLISAADWIVEFGPVGGMRGGRVISQGPVGRMQPSGCYYADRLQPAAR